MSAHLSNLVCDTDELWNKLRETITKEEFESDELKSLRQTYFEHLKWRFGYPKKIFGQQMISSWLITYLVISIVVSGLAFSFIQLYWAFKLVDFNSLNADITFKTGELSFRSSLVGATVLVISLVFFYLYLRHVFAVKEPIPPHISLSETDAIKFLKGVQGNTPELATFKEEAAISKAE